MEKVGKILGQVMTGDGNVAHSATTRTRPTASSGMSGYQRRFNNPLPPSANDDQQEGVEHAEVRSQSAPGEARPENRSYPARRRRIGIRTDLTKVKAILSKVLSHRGLDKKVERYEFILHWPEIVGQRLAEVSRPEYIRNRALIVNVAHPVWAQELTMIKPVLLESLASYLKPGDIVQDMVFRVQGMPRANE